MCRYINIFSPIFIEEKTGASHEVFSRPGGTDRKSHPIPTTHHCGNRSIKGWGGHPLLYMNTLQVTVRYKTWQKKTVLVLIWKKARAAQKN